MNKYTLVYCLKKSNFAC